MIGRPRLMRRAAKRPPARTVTVATGSWVALVAIALAGILLAAFLVAIRVILVQLLCAGILAVSLEPLVQSLERRGLRRPTAVSVTFVLSLVAATAFTFALLPPITEGLPQLVREAPGFLDGLARMIPVDGSSAVTNLQAWWNEKGAGLIGEPTLRLAKGVLDTGSAVVTIVFLGFFLLLSGPEWFRGFLEVVPRRHRDLWRRIGEGITRAVGGYVLGNVLISVIAGTVATIALLVTKVPYAVPLGLLVAVFDLVPMVGATLAAVIVALVALTRGVGTCAIVLGVLVVYQLVENHVLIQAVYHGTVRLSLITIAVSVAIGAELGGVAGALMAIPIAGAIKVVLAEVLAWKRGSKATFAS